MNIIDFTCDRDLSQYVDSILFDSGTSIAELNVKGEDGTLVNICLEVRGEVEISFFGNTYRSPSEFPEALVDLIKKERLYYLHSDIEIEDNNWFEFIYLVQNKKKNIYYSDGVICECDISELTPDDILQTMMDIIKQRKLLD